MTLVLAHVSDLHVSAFGDTFHDRLKMVRRSARIADTADARWEVAWAESGWRVLREIGRRSPKVALVDPDGYAHPIPPKKGERGTDKVERGARRACRLEARRADTLAASLPRSGAVDILLEATPSNVNVRLLRAAREVGPDTNIVIVTGDLTDDGAGHALVRAAFQSHAGRERLLCVPGNHDRYLFPMQGSERPRPTHESKALSWRAFMESTGTVPEPCGAWVRAFPEGDCVILGLDSCRRQRRFYRHNGSVGEEQLAFARAIAARDPWRSARHRLVLLHHHVVPLPVGVGRGAPSEIGMRLDDSKAAAACFEEIGATLVLHGHRHVSERRQPAGASFTILSAPSLTLGCKSGDAPSYWRIELDDRAHVERRKIPFANAHGEEAEADLVAAEDEA